MAEYSRPFQIPDVGGVAQGYTEAQTDEYFSWIMKQNGIRRSTATWATGDLKVYASTPAAMSVEVAVGGAFIRGCGYDNTAVKTLTIDAAHATLDRTDSIVVRRSANAPNSAIIVTVLKGVDAAAGTSVPTALTQTSSTHELLLATVLVSAAVVSIAGTGTTLITDTRLSTSCGMCAPQLGFLSMDAATGNLTVESKRITGLADPSGDQDADTKAARNAAIAAITSLPATAGNAGKELIVNAGADGTEWTDRQVFYTPSASNTSQITRAGSITVNVVTGYQYVCINLPANIMPGVIRVKYTLATATSNHIYVTVFDGVGGVELYAYDDVTNTTTAKSHDISFTGGVVCLGCQVSTGTGTLSSMSLCYTETITSTFT